MTIGENIRNARKALKMSQDELAEKIGANRVTITKYETGAYLPSVPALQRIAEALGTTQAKLTGEQIGDASVPQTKEARTVSAGMDELPKAQREMILNMVTAMFPDVFKKG